jgi:hypothetical protein
VASEYSYQWRGGLHDEEMVDLALSHGGEPEVGWWDRVRPPLPRRLSYSSTASEIGIGLWSSWVLVPDYVWAKLLG